jgi:hypothetical protein
MILLLAAAARCQARLETALVAGVIG